MNNENVVAGEAAAGPDSLEVRHRDEVAALSDTIDKLNSKIKTQAEEKERSDAIAVLFQQQREANEHLVLATFGAQDLQATAEARATRQTEFLSMLAHELRNPLQPMAMANDLLKDLAEMHPNIARVHGVVGRQIAHMVRLVDDLLDASRVSSGKITLRRTAVLLSEIIANAVEASQPAIDRRNQHLRVELAGPGFVVEGDLVRLAQVFSNLLMNASKFTHEYGHISLTAKRVSTFVEVTVSDDGTGVPPDIQPFIFDLFTQGFRSLDRAQGGLGIGLSLVRTITQLHGGSAEVVSAGSGLGSKFVVKLPLSSLKLRDTSVPVPDGPATPCRVLLIEDNVDANDILAMLLRQGQHHVTTCFDGPSGLRAGLDHQFDIVVCDIGLPGMDGYQVVSALRASLKSPLPCFVATTGYGEPGQPDRASQAGFDHYLVKPIHLPSLTRVIASHAAHGSRR